MIKFQKLWEAYPTIQGDKAPCKTNGKKNFEDQCAIRLGAALAKNGVKTTNLVPKGRHCWQHETIEGHVLAAEELANGLVKFPIAGVQRKIDVDPSTFQKEIAGKKGIVFFKDFWTRNGESFRNRSGDHIDLWNGSRLTDWRTWFLISSTFNTGETTASLRKYGFGGYCEIPYSDHYSIYIAFCGLVFFRQVFRACNT